MGHSNGAHIGAMVHPGDIKVSSLSKSGLLFCHLNQLILERDISFNRVRYIGGGFVFALISLIEIVYLKNGIGYKIN